MRIFDAHTHVDTRGLGDLQTLALFGLEALVTCAHDALPYSAPESLLDHFERLLDFDCRRLRSSAIAPYVALGVHPRGIPKRDVKQVLDKLPLLLTRQPVVAVGEIGLQDDTDEEREVFRSQLEIARQLNMPCVAHTPAGDKAAVTSEILSIVDAVGIDKSLILIDHVDERNFDLVRDSGCWIGLTVQSGKLSEERAAALVEVGDRDRIVLDSDLASSSSELLALPKTILELRKRGLPRPEIEKVAFDNACRLYRVNL